MMSVIRRLSMIAIVMILAAEASAAEQCTPPPGLFTRFEVDHRGQQAPSTAYLADGEAEATLADSRGRGRVVNFWATWCAPCVKEMPALDRLHAELAPHGIDVLALSSDRQGAPVVRRFYDENGIGNLDVLIDPKGQVSRALSVRGLPTTILFDGQGREVGRVLGIAEWDTQPMVAFLSRCLGADARTGTNVDLRAGFRAGTRVQAQVQAPAEAGVDAR
jgi:thiol-disulfide isomerase/thioredoxin